MKSEEYWQISNIAISGDPKETDNPYTYGKELTALLQTTHDKVQKRKIKNPEELHKLIAKHDNVPAFKNYLVILYNLAGKQEKARSTNRQLLKEYPDYLFAKLNLCSEYLVTDRVEDIPKVLGEDLNLGSLYPERKVFHIKEFSAFQSLVGHYWLASGQLEEAKMCIDMTTEVLGFRDPVILGLRQRYKEKIQFKAIEPYLEALKKRYELEEYRPEIHPLPAQTSDVPEFTHPLIGELYTHDFDIENATLEAILKLPRESLIDDLEKVILDCSRRLRYFQKEQEKKGWDNFSSDFFVHAVALLTELGAKEKIPLILQSISYGEAFTEFYLGEHLTETLWKFFYRLYQDEPDTLKTWLIHLEYNREAKIPVNQALTQIAMHQPEKKESIIEIYEEVLDFFIENLENPVISAEETITEVVSDLAGLRAERLLPKIKIFYDLELVDDIFYGDYEDVEKIMNEPFSDLEKYVYFDNIYKVYEDIRQLWKSHDNEEDDFDEGDFDEDDYIYQKRETEAKIRRLDPDFGLGDFDISKKASTKKTGRNQLCPCGSGKKYKHCCL